MTAGRKIDLPPAGDLAADIRNGIPLADLATDHGCSTHLLDKALLNAGYSPVTGEHKRAKRHRDNTPRPPIGGACKDQMWLFDDADEHADRGRPGAPPHPDVAAAKAVCRGCSVVAGCLEWSLATRTKTGVWGGLTPRERDRLVRSGR